MHFKIVRLFCLALIFACSLFFFSVKGAPQYYDGGHEPGNTRWKVLKGKNFQIIFPDTLEGVAHSTATMLDDALEKLDTFFSRPFRPLPVVLHNQKSVSNAFAGWAPSRMEFFTIPPPDGYAQNWLEQLTVHESVHWGQYSRMYSGLTSLLSNLFGEHVPAGVMGLYIPFWAIEGEAVYYETHLSASGRGRDASFEQLLRIRLITNRPYTYDKAYFGSYRDVTPNHYEFGYQLAAFGAMRKGPLFWDDVYTYVARNPWNPMAFNSALKKNSGVGKRRFYKAVMKELSEYWRNIDAENSSDTHSEAVTSSSSWVFYKHPIPFNSGDVIAKCSSPGEITAIVRISENGKQRVVFHPGYGLGDAMSMCDQRVWFTSYSRHPRWPNIEYSDIWVYDGQYDTLAKYTDKERYFSPVEDPVSGELYAVRYNENHRFSLVKMGDQAEIATDIMLPSGMEVSQTAWWNVGDRLIFVATTNSGKGVYSWDGIGSIEPITPTTYANIAHPQGYKNGIVFQADFQGINQIYYYNTDSSTLWQLTNSRFGATNPGIDHNGDLVYVASIAKGAQIFRLRSEHFFMMKENWALHPSGFYFADKIIPCVRQEEEPRDSSDVEKYTTTTYKPFQNLFRLHSWSFPVAIDPATESVLPGASVLSQNTLSTAFFRAAVEFDPNTPSVKSFATFYYKGFFPILSFSAGNTTIFRKSANNDEVYSYQRPYSDINFQIPLTQIKRHYTHYTKLQTGLSSLAFIPGSSKQDSSVLKGGVLYGHTTIYFHKLRQMAKRDLYPKWGWGIDLRGVYSLTGYLNAGTVFGARAVAFAPGILRNHGIRFDGGVQIRRKGEDLLFNRIVSVPRGLPFLDTVNNAVNASLSYRFPLLYPDFSIPPFIYIKRISVTLFSDALSDLYNLKGFRYSYGGEILFDVHLLRHFAPFSLGYGVAVNDENKVWHYPLVGVTFSL